MYWRGNQESLELSFLKDLFPHKGKEFEQWVWSPVMMGYWILGYTQRRSCLWVKILPRQPNRDGRHIKQICCWSCWFVNSGSNALFEDVLGWYLRLSVVRITLSCRTRCSSGASIAALSIKGSWYSYFSKPSPRLAPSYILQPVCCSSQLLWVGFWGPEIVASSCTHLRHAHVMKVIYINI